jgi:hypothetical protein
VPQSPAADVTSVPVRHDAVQRSATLARHYASIRNLVMPTEGMARSITDVRERLQHRHKYSSLRLNAFSTDVGMATPTELGACPLAHDEAARAGATPRPCGATALAPAVVVPIVSPTAATAAAAAFADAGSPGAPTAPLPAGAEGATRVVKFAPSPQGMARRRVHAGMASSAAAPERPPGHRRVSTSTDVLAHNGRGAFGVYTRHAAAAALPPPTVCPPRVATSAPAPTAEMVAAVPMTTAAPSEGEPPAPEAATQAIALEPPARGRRDRFSAAERLTFLRGLHSSEARLPSGRLLLLTEGADASVAAPGFSGNASVPLPLPPAAEQKVEAGDTVGSATPAEERTASADAPVTGGPIRGRIAPAPGEGTAATSGPTPTPVPSPTRVLHEPAEHPLPRPTAVRGLQRLKGSFQRTVFRSERRNREPPLRAVPEEPTHATTPPGVQPASMAGTGAGGEVAGAAAHAATAVTIAPQPAPPATEEILGGVDAGAAPSSWLRRITRRGIKSTPPPLRTTDGEEQTAAGAVAGAGAGSSGGATAAGAGVSSARPRCVESVILIPLAVLEAQKIDPALLAAVLRARQRTETVYQQRRQLHRLRARREARRQEHMGRRWLRHAHRRVAACFGMTVPPPPPHVVEAEGNAVAPQDVDTGSPELTWMQRRDREAELASVTGRLKDRAATGMPAGAGAGAGTRVSTAHVPLSLIPFGDDTSAEAAERKETPPAPSQPLLTGLPAGSTDVSAPEAGAAKAEPVIVAAGAGAPHLFGFVTALSAPPHVPSALLDTSSTAQAPGPHGAAVRGDTSIPIHNAV